MGDGKGALGAGGDFEHSHRAIPKNGRGGGDLLGVGGAGLGADIDALPAVGNVCPGLGKFSGRDGASGKIEFLDDQGVLGEKKANPAFFGLRENGFGQFDLIRFAEGPANFSALGEAKGVAHATPDQNGVGFFEQRAEDADLIAHLGTAQDDEKRGFRLGEFRSEIAEFFLHEESGGGLGGETGAALGRGVGAVGGAEGIVDVNLGGTEKFLSEGRIVLFFFGMEADIFEKKYFAGFEGGARLVGFGTDAVGGKVNGAMKFLCQVGGDGTEGVLFLGLALGPTEMASEN